MLVLVTESGLIVRMKFTPIPVENMRSTHVELPHTTLRLRAWLGSTISGRDTNQTKNWGIRPQGFGPTSVLYPSDAVEEPIPWG